MLLTRAMASIPSTSRQPISTMNDLKNPPVILVSSPIPSSLQYFNIRVTERLHRYRSLKRQWNEVASANQSDPISSPKHESPLPTLDIVPVTQEQLIKDYINFSEVREKNHIDFDPLHSQIQNDLIKLRRLIKSRQKKLKEISPSKTTSHNRPSGEPNLVNDHPRKFISSQRLITLDRVKISGNQMRPSTFPQSDSTSTDTHQSSSSKQNIQHIFNNYRTRMHHQPLPPNSLIQGVPPPSSQKKIIAPLKTTSNINGKQTSPQRLQTPAIIKKKQPTSLKPETPLSRIRQPSATEPTTCRYTYAASTSSVSPCAMKLNRKTSILPILLTSSSCVGIQPRQTHSGKTRNINDQSYNLQDYNHLVSHLPKPVIPIVPRYDQGDYGILFEQLDHIRETMPNANVYENYARNC